jgi:hypothetical protein
VATRWAVLLIGMTGYVTGSLGTSNAGYARRSASSTERSDVAYVHMLCTKELPSNPVRHSGNAAFGHHAHYTILSCFLCFIQCFIGHGDQIVRK